MDLRGLLFCLLIVSIAFGSKLDVFPSPQEIRIEEGVFNLPERIGIFCENTGENENVGLELFRSTVVDELKKKVFNASKKESANILLVVSNSKRDSVSIGGKLFIFSKEMKEEGYYVAIEPQKAIVASKSQKGLYYGILTLRQLILQFGNELPCCVIRDYPELKWRAFSDDISRGQVSTMDNFKKIIRQISMMKYNVYMPYLEDLVRVERYPDIGEGRGALSRQEFEELQNYAQRYFVEVVPIFQTLGHFENILNMDNYRQFAEFPGAASLDIRSKKADEFLFSLLDEVVPIFKSKFFHMGADESWDVGLGKNREYVKKVGLAKAHAEHYLKVYKYLKKHGKKVLMYGDIILSHPEILKYLPKDIIIVDWHYWPSDYYPSVELLKDKGFQVLVSPGIHNWVNPVPNFFFAWLNIRYFNLTGQDKGSIGTVISSWGDFGGPNLREQNYLCYYYGAETAWNSESRNFLELNKHFARYFLGVDGRKFNSLIMYLNMIPANTNFSYIWSYPFYPPQGLSLVKAELLSLASDQALSLIGDMRQEAETNAEYLDYLQIGAKFGKYAGKKLRLARIVDRFLKEYRETGKVDEELKAEILAQMKSLMDDVDTMKKEYTSLWLKANRRANLFRIEQLFNHQRAYLEYAVEKLERNNFDIPQEIPSKWITASLDTVDGFYPESFLRKKFEIKNPQALKRADLQVIANNYCEIYLNGKLVGHLYPVKTLSLMVENMRVKWEEVKGLLKEGENIITLRVKSYRPKFPSSANVVLRLKYLDDQEEWIVSDETWKGSTKPSLLWKTRKDVNWDNCLIYEEYPWKVSPPLFDKGFPSRVEF